MDAIYTDSIKANEECVIDSTALNVLENYAEWRVLVTAQAPSGDEVSMMCRIGVLLIKGQLYPTTQDVISNEIFYQDLAKRTKRLFIRSDSVYIEFNNDKLELIVKADKFDVEVKFSRTERW